MTFEQQFLKLLVCPETKEPVSLADETLISQINAAIETGSVQNRAGEYVIEKIDSGLIREDQKYLYPIRNDIPLILVGKSIPLKTLLS